MVSLKKNVPFLRSTYSKMFCSTFLEGGGGGAAEYASQKEGAALHRNKNPFDIILVVARSLFYVFVSYYHIVSIVLSKVCLM